MYMDGIYSPRLVRVVIEMYVHVWMYLHVRVSVGVAVCEVACIIAMFECIGPCQTVVIDILFRVYPSDGCLEVLDGMSSPLPTDALCRSLHFRVNYRLHAFVVQTTSLRRGERSVMIIC